jgi:glycosyltransferase involved in cell wall biosynthesis
MRIGIDARELRRRATGVGRYLTGLLHEWAIDARTSGHQFVLYAPEPIALRLDARRFPTRLVRGGSGTWWEQVRAPRAARLDHLDVWFAPAYSAPLALKVPIVVTIHDLSFDAHPEWFRPRDGARRRWLTRRAAQKARAIVTVSQFSRRELIERLDVPDSRIHVIPPGLGTGGWGRGDWGPGTGAGHRVPGRLVPGPLVPNLYRVLYVGSIFNRRHVVDLIRAFAPIARAHAGASLDIVGDNRSYPREDLRQSIAAEAIEAQVRWHEYVSEEQLPDLYAGARAFAFLSEYEGLGLTPLEALNAGVPPVLLDTTVARESCGDAAVYVPLSNLPATTRALESVLFDESVRSRILAAAPNQLAKYSWPRAARETIEVLERAGAGTSRSG